MGATSETRVWSKVASVIDARRTLHRYRSEAWLEGQLPILPIKQRLVTVHQHLQVEPRAGARPAATASATIGETNASLASRVT
jgi:hypothetical protein